MRYTNRHSPAHVPAAHRRDIPATRSLQKKAETLLYESRIIIAVDGRVAVACRLGAFLSRRL